MLNTLNIYFFILKEFILARLSTTFSKTMRTAEKLFALVKKIVFHHLVKFWIVRWVKNFSTPSYI